MQIRGSLSQHGQVSSRLFAAVLLVVVAGTAGCTSLHLDSRTVLDPVWVTEGESTLRSNAIDSAIDPPLEEVWTFNAGAGFGPVSPLIVGGVALVSTRRGEVHGIDLETGRRIGQSSFGESIDGTPAVDRGILYLPVSWGRYVIQAYDLRTGNTSWRVEGASVEAGLVIYRDMVIAADLEGYATAYNRSDGSIRWELELGEQAAVRGTPVLVDDRLILGADDGRVSAIDPNDGSILWKTELDAPIFAPLAASEHLVYVPSTRGRLTALELATGEIAWCYSLPDDSAYLTAPAVGAGEVVFGASDGHVRSLNREDGAVLWTTQVDGAVSAPPLLTAHTVYVGTMRSKLVALTRTDGAHVWETKVEGRIKSPFAARGTQLIVQTEPRHVYLFDVEKERYANREE